MKHTFKQLSKKIKTAVLALVVFAASFAAGANAAPEDFLDPTLPVVSRIGSVMITSSPLGFVTNTVLGGRSTCERQSNAGAAESCLDVQGAAAFAGLKMRDMKYFVPSFFRIGTVAEGDIATQTAPFVIAGTDAEDTAMVSDLGRFNASGEFEPVDQTTLRAVCTDENGKFIANSDINGSSSCEIPTATTFNCPLTATYESKIYPIVDIDGTCWFGEDLESQKITAAEALEFEKGAGLEWAHFPEPGTYYNSNYHYPSPAGVTFTDLPLLRQKCEVLLSDPYYYMHIGSFGSNNGKTANYELTCINEDQDEEVTVQYIYSTVDGFGSAPGEFFLSDMVRSDTCPAGWHVPTDEQWREMETFIGVSNVNSFSSSHRGGNPVWGVTDNGTQGSLISRDVSATHPKIVEMGFANSQSYYMRDRARSQRSNGTWGLGHMVRDLSSTGTGNIRFGRDAKEGDVHASYVQLVPMSPALRLAKFVGIKIANAFTTGPAKARIRCVQGSGDLSRSIGGWGACTSNGAFPTPSWTQTRSYSCYAGGYQIATGHCDTEFGAVSTTRSCLPSSGGGGSRR